MSSRTASFRFSRTVVAARRTVPYCGDTPPDRPDQPDGASPVPSGEARLTFAEPPASVSARTGPGDIRSQAVELFAPGERRMGNIGGRTCIESA